MTVALALVLVPAPSLRVTVRVVLPSSAKVWFAKILNEPSWFARTVHVRAFPGNQIDIFDNQQRRFEKPRQPEVLADEQDLL